MAASMSVCLQVFNETDFYRRMLLSLQASKKRRGAPSTHTYVGIVCPRPLKWSTMPEIRPWYMTLPLANTRIRLIVSRSRKLGWWIVSRTVRWCVTAIWESICITCSAEVLSRPEVGSSRNNTDGSWIKSTPIETRRLSPPDTPLTWITKKSAKGNLKVCNLETLSSSFSWRVSDVIGAHEVCQQIIEELWQIEEEENKGRRGNGQNLLITNISIGTFYKAQLLYERINTTRFLLIWHAAR